MSAAGAGEVPVDPRTGPAATVTSFGNVAITQGTLLDVSDPTNRGSGGSVLIRASALTVDASEIDADNFGAGNGGRIVLHGDDQVTVTDGAYVHAMAMASGQGAGITMRTASGGSVTIDGSTVLAGSMAAGDGGIVDIAAPVVTVRDGAAFVGTAKVPAQAATS